MNNILFCKVFGIGNAVMAVPALKALRERYPHARIDVMLGTTPDDGGARDVLQRLLKDPYDPYNARNIPIIDRIYFDQATDVEYDLAILSIPFDGRWRNGANFKAKRTIDGRTRPDPSTIGLISWKRHEAEYQDENILSSSPFQSYLDPRPPLLSCQFISDARLRQIEEHWKPISKRIYVGVGYKKDAAGFWKVKHWGNDNFVQLIKRLLASDPELNVISTGDIQDVQHSLGSIVRGVNDPRFQIMPSPRLYDCFELVASCGTYVGNDTGMMHVAASCNRNVVAVFNLENSIVKSRPLCDRHVTLDGSKVPVTVDQMFEATRELLQRV
jgi:ADP-heptose:LPS heptosyltransferase